MMCHLLWTPILCFGQPQFDNMKSEIPETAREFLIGTALSSVRFHTIPLCPARDVNHRFCPEDPLCIHYLLTRH
jgi:hypothetical protein